MKQTQIPIMSTRDLGQIASLMSIGIQPRDFHQQNGMLVAEFDDTAETKNAIRDYVTDRLRVSPRALLSLMRDLKGMANLNGSQTVARR